MFDYKILKIMISEELLQLIIESQSRPLLENLVKREQSIPESKHRAVIVTGIRRCGKSTLLKSLNRASDSLFINFEDPRLEGFSVNDFFKLEKIAETQKSKNFIFDEIQNVTGWEKYVNTAVERGLKIYITGSNAKLLSKELGTKLTGRYLQVELFPFSYNEFLNQQESHPSLASFESYIETGGFPEYLLYQEPDYLRTLLTDIIYRDIVVRRNIRHKSTLMRLATYLMSNSGKEFSYNKLTKLLEIKSVRTTIDYIDYLSETYLFEELPLYTHSIRKQIANPKKIYAIDTGMIRSNSLSLSKDFDRLLETSVYQFIRRTFVSVKYYKSGKSECDFICEGNDGSLTAIQVCSKLNELNLEREINGIKDAMEEIGILKAMIITQDQEDKIEGIPVIPVWKWMSTLIVP